MIGYIEYKGKKSSDFDIMLDADMTFSSPEVDIEFEKIPGLDGEIALSDKTLKNVARSFAGYVEPAEGVSLESRATDISNWLKTDVGWYDLFFSGDPDYIYSGIYHETYDVDRLVEEYNKILLTFTLKPYKFLKSGLTEIALPSQLINPSARNAKPKLTITGTGNITVKIGSSVLTLKSVDGGVIVDSLSQTIGSLDGTRTQWEKMTSYPFPVIAPGKQTVTVTGTVTSIKIIPRWEVIVG